MKKLLVLLLVAGLLVISVACSSDKDDVSAAENSSYNINAQVIAETNDIDLSKIKVKISGNEIEDSTSELDEEDMWSATGLKGEVTVTPVDDSNQYTFIPSKVVLTSNSEEISFTVTEKIQIEPISGLSDDFIRGMDVSALKAIEESGGKYYENGEEKDLLEILKGRGVNYIRLRLWNDPSGKGGGETDLETVKELAKRAKDLEMKVFLDFHYSDFWADPGKQHKPFAWEELSFEELKQAVYEFTYTSLKELDNAGALPDMVQIGNEVNNGMLWPDGMLWPYLDEFPDYTEDVVGGWSGFGALLQEGLDAIDQIEAETGEEIKSVIHKADAGEGVDWFIKDLEEKGGVTGFDVVGISYYPYWEKHGGLRDNYTGWTNLLQEMTALANRGYEVAVVETSYGFTLEGADDEPNHLDQERLDTIAALDDGRYLPTPSIQGQADLVREVMEVVNEVPDNKGLGIFYWGGELIPSEGATWKAGEEYGNGYENQALFDFKGNALPSLDVFNKVIDN